MVFIKVCKGLRKYLHAALSTGGMNRLYEKEEWKKKL